jgi:hypothetical protein
MEKISKLQKATKPAPEVKKWRLGDSLQLG